MRYLLQLGNSKLGSAIHHWSLPAGITCVGKTEICESHCYAMRGRYSFAKVREKLAWNLEQANRYDFVSRMVHEINQQGVLVLRVHASGDFFSKSYAENWYMIMKRCPKVRFYWYTRSWSVREIEPVLNRMGKLKCCRGWYSIDDSSTIKPPPHIRLAYLQTVDNVPPPVDLVLRIRKLRRNFALPIVCPAETVKGKGTNCGACKRCFG